MAPISGVPAAHDAGSRDLWPRYAALILALMVWLALNKAFWVGYAGSDDLFYARYAFLFHRQPINWWEGRLPAILAIRASFHLFGVGELAAALPTLIASLAATAAIAWYVGWPRNLNWQTNSTVLIAASLPLDVTFRTVPGASFLAGGLLVIGSICILKGGRFLDPAGAVCFAAAFSTHELSCYYIAIFLGTALVFDRRRFLRPLVYSIVFVLAATGAQSAWYAVQYGDPLLRFRLAMSESAHQSGLYDPDTHLRGVRFLLWPIQTMIFSKAFGCDLLLLFVLGAAAWRKLLVNQRILLVSGFLTWFYLGFGTKIPWAYRPLARMVHFYDPLSLSIAVLLPLSIGYWFRNSAKPRGYSIATVAGILALHLVCLAGGGRWGQAVKVTKSLLDYASSHPSSTFLTDVATMNQMYAQNGFKLPANVVCTNGPDVENDLLVNKEPPNMKPAHGITFPNRPIDGILWNREETDMDSGADPDFARFMAGHPGPHTRIVPVRYKPLFVPVEHLMQGRTFTLASDGADLIRLR